MTLLRDTNIQFADSPSIDAFGRLRVGEPRLLLDLKRVGSTPDLLSTSATTGSGAVAYQVNRASTYMTVGNTAGSAIRQSKARGIYQPGKSMMAFVTFVMTTGQANLKQKVGYFDSKNGIFLQQDNTTAQVVRRTYVSGAAVDTAVDQANWNIDTLTGAGGAANPSGMTLNLSKAQILIIDMEWLGVGRVRVGFVINGLIYYVHEFLNSNTTLTSVYMSNPNLPIRWEIEATADITGTATMESICASLSSEGGYDITGVTAATDMGGTINTIAGGGFKEILAIRLQASYTEFATAFIQNLSVLAASSSNFIWRLVMNPTETVAGTWSSLTNSVLEKNTTRMVTENTGLPIASGYVAAAQNSVTVADRPVVTLGTTLAGVTDVYSLQVRNLSAGNEDYLGSLTWREVY